MILMLINLLFFVDFNSFERGTLQQVLQDVSVEISDEWVVTWKYLGCNSKSTIHNEGVLNVGIVSC